MQSLLCPLYVFNGTISKREISYIRSERTGLSSKYGNGKLVKISKFGLVMHTNVYYEVAFDNVKYKEFRADMLIWIWFKY